MQPKEYHATEHDLDSKLIDPDALFIMDKLREAGFAAYLVGGSVRDLLVKKRPKDFDISTSASPEQVKQVTPWATLEDIEGQSEAALQTSGYGMPPIHGSCRCDILSVT